MKQSLALKTDFVATSYIHFLEFISLPLIIENFRAVITLNSFRWNMRIVLQLEAS